MSLISRVRAGVTAMLAPMLGLFAGSSGKTFYVSSTHVKAANVAGNGRLEAPFASIAYAITQCTAAKGDSIIALQFHVETVGSAAAVALSKSGVSLKGIGEGGAKPKINFTATDATMTVSGASVTIENILFTGGIDAVVSALVISGADCTIRNCEYRDVTGQITTFILTTAAADRLTIDNLEYRGDAAAGTAAAIAIVGGDGHILRDLRIIGNFSVSAIDFRTTAATNVQIYGTTSGSFYIWTKNAADLCIKDTVTGSTGRCGPNLYFMLTDNAANITEAITGATFQQFAPILVNNLAGEQAMAINTTTATDA